MKKFGFFFLILITLSSCTNLVFRALGIYKEEVKLHKYENGSKEVVFIPMQHIGKSEFYDDVASKIDSLNQLGYFVFCEGVLSGTKNKDSLEILVKKYRRLTGLGISKGGYLNNESNKIAGVYDFKNKQNLVNQPSYKILKVDSLNSRNADLTLDSLIKFYEQNYTKVELQDCDINTHIDSSYNCSSMGNKITGEFIMDVVVDHRNKHLAKLVQQSEYEKITIIYGKLHLRGFYNELKAIDEKWVKQKIN